VSNHYVDRFLNLRCSSDVLGVVNPIGNKPSKEISEAMTIIQRVKPLALQQPMHYGLLDLCAGNGLIGVLSVFSLPIKWAIGVDKRPRYRPWWKAKRFQYTKDDIFSPGMLHLDACNSDPIILTACHPCETKAERIIEICLANKCIRHLVLMPCCEDRAVKPLYPERLRKVLGSYEVWAFHLAQLAKGTYFIDNDCLSPKNAVIVASKEEEK